MKTEWGPGDVNAAGGLDNWEKQNIGFGLLKQGEIISEASVGPPCRGMYEPGVFTQEAHRRNGHGTLVSARLIHQIEQMGGTSYWNCAKQNRPSASIARKLGYQVEKEYRVIAWEQTY
jgi:predicted GNAT family acetyltransferase